MSGRYSVGMVAPGELIVHTVIAPNGVNLLSAGSIAYALAISGRKTKTLTDWAISGVSETGFTATYEPDGTEFEGIGDTATFRPTVTVDGTVYRMAKTVEQIDPR